MQFIISIILGYNYKVVDIDDIILNTIGGIIGYILYKLVCIIFELNDKKIRQKNLQLKIALIKNNLYKL